MSTRRRAARRSMPKYWGYGAVGRCLPHHRAVRGWRRRLPVDVGGAGAWRGITPDQVDYINAHGTSTMADTIELGAVERVDGRRGGQGDDVVDEIRNRASSGGRGRCRGDLLRSRDPRSDRTADDQPRRSSGGAEARPGAPTRPVSAKSRSHCRTRSASGGTNASLVLGRVAD